MSRFFVFPLERERSARVLTTIRTFLPLMTNRFFWRLALNLLLLLLFAWLTWFPVLARFPVNLQAFGISLSLLFGSDERSSGLFSLERSHYIPKGGNSAS